MAAPERVPTTVHPLDDPALGPAFDRFCRHLCRLAADAWRQQQAQAAPGEKSTQETEVS